ncbi:MAG: hypothetical protein GX654_03900, partial [Desulfatiglans sp.]|nr:hypothetical protein [Desulfatiglans sp.]
MKLKKFKNQKFSFMAIVGFMIIMLITGCGDKTTVGEKSGGDTGVGKVPYYDIVGVVVNDSGDPIQHVFIDVIDFVMSDGGEEPFVATVRSDGNGEFGLRIPGDNPVRQVTLRFAFQNVVTYVRDVAVIANQEVDLETITLTVMSQKTINDSTIENTLNDNVRTNAYVTIGANALRYSDGTAFSTATPVPEDEDPITATVAIGYVDTTSNPEFFPDNFYSMVNGSLRLFSTYGILEIKVTTDNGNKILSLAPGQTATISIPVGNIINVNDPDFPATVDLWYYDENAAEWVLEQKDGLTYHAATRSFTGVVNHFSTFNAGYTFESKYVQANVQDDRGMMCPSEEYDAEDQCTVPEEPYLIPLPGSTLNIFSDTFSPYGVWNATYTAGADGKIPDRMNPSIAGLLYNDADGYFLPVPGTGRLMALLEYTNPRNNEDGSKGPDLIAFEEGEIKISHDYILPLSTSAFIMGKVFYENGEPAEGAVFMFNDPLSPVARYSGGIVDEEGLLREATFGWFTGWVQKEGSEAVVPVVAEIESYVMVPSGSAVTAIKEARWGSLNGELIDTPYVCGEGLFADLDCGTYGTWEDNGAIVLTSPKLNESIDLYVILADPPGDIRYTHLRGTIDLNDIPDDVDPDNLWVVIKGMYNDRPITVRGAVDADGNWPAGDGTFNPVTLEGEEGLWLQVPADTALTITIGDYITDPLTPVTYQTYTYTSKNDLENISSDPENPIYVPIATEIVLAKNTYISGTVIYKGKPTKGLKVVLENLTDTDEDDITIITQAGGVIPQKALPFSTNYRVTVWSTYPDSTLSFELLYTHPVLISTAATGGPENDLILEIDFGVPDPETGPFIPVIPADMAAIVGTVLDAEGNPAAGTEIWVSPNGAFGPTSIACTVGDDGELSQLTGYMGTVLHEGFVVLDPTVAYYE